MKRDETTPHTLGNGATYLHIEAVDEMIRRWQEECSDHPAIYNQGNVLRDRLAKLQAHIETPISEVDVTGWGVWAGHAIPVRVARYIAEKVNSLLAHGAIMKRDETTPTPQEAATPLEPVGWRCVSKKTGTIGLYEKPLADFPFNRENWTCEPLYTVAPAASSQERMAQLEAALRAIAEGNLGNDPWQADYARIKQVAATALAFLPQPPAA